MIKKIENQTNFDLLDVLGLDFPVEEREAYYQELLQIFLFNFIQSIVLNSKDTEETRALQKEVNQKSSPDEVLGILQQQHPDFMLKFIQFVDDQKILFVINFIQGVIDNLKNKRQITNNTAFDKKIKKYQAALTAAQGENWVELKNILNHGTQLTP